MFPDNFNLLLTWEKALTGLANHEDEEWDKYFTLAKFQSRLNLTPCSENSELTDIGYQLTRWWGFFWSDEDAQT